MNPQWTFVIVAVLLQHSVVCWSFSHPSPITHLSQSRHRICSQQQRQKQPTTYSSASSTTAIWAQISEKEAKTAIDKVVAALRKDSTANSELGRLERVTVVLGYGAPVSGSVAVRFNAQFKKSGFGLSATPLPFGLGQTNKSEGRGTMVGQVKATVDDNTGKVSSCSVFRDLGYGRSFTLKV